MLFALTFMKKRKKLDCGLLRNGCSKFCSDQKLHNFVNLFATHHVVKGSPIMTAKQFWNNFQIKKVAKSRHLLLNYFLTSVEYNNLTISFWIIKMNFHLWENICYVYSITNIKSNIKLCKNKMSTHFFFSSLIILRFIN